MKTKQIESNLEDVLRVGLTELSKDDLPRFSTEELRQLCRLQLFLENENLTGRYSGDNCRDLEKVRLSIRVEDGEYVFPQPSKPQQLETLPNWVAGQMELAVLTECPRALVNREILVECVKRYGVSLDSDFESIIDDFLSEVAEASESEVDSSSSEPTWD